jgi:hypothetical protein
VYFDLQHKSSTRQDCCQKRRRSGTRACVIHVNAPCYQNIGHTLQCVVAFP